MAKKFNFTQDRIKELPTPEKGRVDYYDKKVPKLTCRVSATGNKSFVVLKKNYAGKVQRVTLGKFPDMSVYEAQKQALKTLIQLADGIDPNQKKKADKVKGITLQQCFDDYLYTKTKLKPGTVHDYKRVMNEGFNDWQDQPLKNISRDKVAAKHRKLGKNSEARANNAMRVLRALFNFAAEVYEDEEGRTLFPDNPVKRLSKTKTWYSVERKQTIIKEHELKAWFATVLSLSPNDGGLYETVKDYFLVLMLTGMRRTECAKLIWDNVDFEHKTIKLVNTKNSKPHTLPLSDYLYDLLSQRYSRRTQEHFIFPNDATATGHIEELRRFIEIVIERSGVNFTLHDTRRTFITTAEGRDISIYALKRLVNHSTKNSDVTDGYIINDVERLRKPMQQITDYILKVAQVKPSATIIELKEANLN